MPDPDPERRVPPARSGKAVVFVRRLGSTLALWGVVAAAMILGNMYLFFVILGGISLIALREYYRLLGHEGASPYRRLTFLITIVYLVGIYWYCAVRGSEEFYVIDVAAICALVISSFVVALGRELRGRETLTLIVSDLFGFIYIVFLFNFVTRLLFLPGVEENSVQAGVAYVLYVVAVTKFTDMGAYSIGSLIGRHKMIPHISPGKTWEGFGGAILGAMVASHGVLLLFPHALSLLNHGHATLLAVVLAVFAVLGDLAESVVKRCVGAKDSGQFIPGIGGAMDLIDSLCFTAPVFYFYLKFLSVADGQ